MLDLYSKNLAKVAPHFYSRNTFTTDSAQTLLRLVHACDTEDYKNLLQILIQGNPKTRNAELQPFASVITRAHVASQVLSIRTRPNFPSAIEALLSTPAGIGAYAQATDGGQFLITLLSANDIGGPRALATCWASVFLTFVFGLSSNSCNFGVALLQVCRNVSLKEIDEQMATDDISMRFHTELKSENVQQLTLYLSNLVSICIQLPSLVTFHLRLLALFISKLGANTHHVDLTSPISAAFEIALNPTLNTFGVNDATTKGIDWDLLDTLTASASGIGASVNTSAFQQLLSHLAAEVPEKFFISFTPLFLRANAISLFNADTVNVLLKLDFWGPVSHWLQALLTSPSTPPSQILLIFDTTSESKFLPHNLLCCTLHAIMERNILSQCQEAKISLIWAILDDTFVRSLSPQQLHAVIKFACLSLQQFSWNLSEDKQNRLMTAAGSLIRRCTDIDIELLISVVQLLTTFSSVPNAEVVLQGFFYALGSDLPALLKDNPNTAMCILQVVLRSSNCPGWKTVVQKCIVPFLFPHANMPIIQKLIERAIDFTEEEKSLTNLEDNSTHQEVDQQDSLFYSLAQGGSTKKQHLLLHQSMSAYECVQFTATCQGILDDESVSWEPKLTDKVFSLESHKALSIHGEGTFCIKVHLKATPTSSQNQSASSLEVSLYVNRLLHCTVMGSIGEVIKLSKAIDVPPTGASCYIKCHTRQGCAFSLDTSNDNSCSLSVSRLPLKIRELCSPLCRGSGPPITDLSLLVKGAICTPTTLINISAIKRAQYDTTPVLLCGDTGTAKTFTITAAAVLAKVEFIRVNMHAQMTDEDLFGKLVKTPKGFEFELQIFSRAYKNGMWLLLDELNLARSEVLVRIESALASSTLHVGQYTIKRDPNFRLFATQNPDTGVWRGKRTVLPKSLLSLFRIQNFIHLPFPEWVEVLSGLIPQGDQTIVGQVVAFAQDYLTKPYAMHNYGQITIRELRRWADSYHSTGDIQASSWCVFAARHRGDDLYSVNHLLQSHKLLESSTMKKINFSLVKVGQPKFALVVKTCIQSRIRSFCQRQGIASNVSTKIIEGVTDLSLSDVASKSFESLFETSGLDSKFCTTLALECIKLTDASSFLGCGTTFFPVRCKTSGSHATLLRHLYTMILEVLYSEAFFSLYGLYLVPHKLYQKWLEGTALSFGMSLKQIVVNIISEVAGCLRSTRGRNEFLHLIVHKVKAEFGVTDLTESEIPLLSHNVTPIVVTDRLQQTWNSLSLAMQLAMPILLTGSKGCGKSACVSTLAGLMGQNVIPYNMTKETEAAELIGKFAPSEDKSSHSIEWKNGFLTQAALNGRLILLENLSNADDVLLERLNPILEPAHERKLVLTEKSAEDLTKDIKETFRVFCTVTVGESELSPALYNRFSIIHVPDPDQGAYVTEIEAMCTILCGDHQELARDCALQLKETTIALKRKLDMREISRIANVSFRLREMFPHIDGSKPILEQALGLILGKELGFPPMDLDVKSQMGIKWPDDYVLSPLRTRILNSILMCLNSAIPILLEGPPAVGKSQIVHSLSKCYKINGKILHLEQITNSESMTVNDFYGSYIVTDQVEFSSGPLARAVQEGFLLLVDELNLADSEVLNVLLPILEGAPLVFNPVSGDLMTVHKDFRLIATQNSRSDVGRNKLPPSIASRLITIGFPAFTNSEFLSLIMSIGCPESEAPNLSNLYRAGSMPPMQLTLREVKKLIRRYKSDSISSLVGGVSKMSTYAATMLTHRASNTIDVCDLLKREMGYAIDIKGPATIVWNPAKKQVSFDYGGVMSTMEGDLTRTTIYSLCSNVNSWPQQLKRVMSLVSFALCCREPVLLFGPTGYKSLVLKTFAELLQRPKRITFLTSDTETSDLLGQLQPMSAVTLVQEIVRLIFFIEDCLPASFKLLSSASGAVQKVAQKLQNQTTKVSRITEDMQATEEEESHYSNEWVAESYQENTFEQEPLIEDAESPDNGQEAQNSMNEQNFNPLGALEYNDFNDDMTNSHTENEIEVEKSPDDAPFNPLSSVESHEGDVVQGTPQEEPDNNFLSFPKEQLDEFLTVVGDFLVSIPKGNLTDANILVSTRKLNSLLEVLKALSSKPYFHFVDGPIPDAAATGKFLILEDYDLPSASTMERLNPLFDIQPSLILPEDSSFNLGGGKTCQSCEVGIHPSFYVGATVREAGLPKISPATQSRFTPIFCAPYSLCELCDVARMQLSAASVPSLNLSLFHQLVTKCLEDCKPLNNIRYVLRWASYICRTPLDIDSIHLAGYWIFLEFAPQEARERLRASWLDGIDFGNYPETKALTKGCEFKPSESFNSRQFSSMFVNKDGVLKMVHTGATVPFCVKEPAPEESKNMCVTPNVLDFVGSVFVAMGCKSHCQRVYPIAFEGPPGCGKTKLATVIAAMAGKRLVRINFCEGLTFLLLDELNLAPCEVLDALGPILDAEIEVLSFPDGQVINLKDVVIFAAMNSTNIGGGRRALPPSISALFTHISVQDYSNEELCNIACKMFEDLGPYLGDASALSPSTMMKNILLVFTAINDGLKDRHFGGGSLTAFNLRDLNKLHELLQGSVKDFLLESRLKAKKKREHTGESTEGEETDNTLANEHISGGSIIKKLLYKLLQIVFVFPFPSVSDREKVQTIISDVFKCESYAIVGVPQVTATIAHVGDVFIGRKNQGCETFGASHKFVYTPKACRYLEALCAAVLAKCPVLLLGDTCTGKTATLLELARLAGRELLVIGMHEDFDIASLIGTLSPQKNITLEHTHKELTRALRLCIKGQQLLFGQKKIKIAHSMGLKLSEVWTTLDMYGNDKAKLSAICEDFIQMSDTLKKCEMAYVSQEIFQIATSSRKALQMRVDVAFEFEESKFINAVRTGAWVVFDNVNCAPPEIVERLNSLLENPPVLDMHESGKDLRLCDASICCGTDEAIHSDFRIFFTANLSRGGVSRLSSAFMNRVLVIQFDSLECNINNVDTFQIVNEVYTEKMGTSDPGVVSALLRFHKLAADMDIPALRTVSGAELTLRTVLHAIECMVTLVMHFHMKVEEGLVATLQLLYIDRATEYRQGDLLNYLKEDSTIWHTALQQLEISNSLAALPPEQVLETTMRQLEKTFLEYVAFLLTNLDPSHQKPLFESIGETLHHLVPESLMEFLGTFVGTKGKESIESVLNGTCELLCSSLLKLYSSTTWNNAPPRQSLLRRIRTIIKCFVAVAASLPGGNKIIVFLDNIDATSNRVLHSFDEVFSDTMKKNFISFTELLNKNDYRFIIRECEVVLSQIPMHLCWPRLIDIWKETRPDLLELEKSQPAVLTAFDQTCMSLCSSSLLWSTHLQTYPFLSTTFQANLRQIRLKKMAVRIRTKLIALIQEGNIEAVNEFVGTTTTQIQKEALSYETLTQIAGTSTILQPALLHNKERSYFKSFEVLYSLHRKDLTCIGGGPFTTFAGKTLLYLWAQKHFGDLEGQIRMVCEASDLMTTLHNCKCPFVVFLREEDAHSACFLHNSQSTVVYIACGNCSTLVKMIKNVIATSKTLKLDTLKSSWHKEVASALPAVATELGQPAQTDLSNFLLATVRDVIPPGCLDDLLSDLNNCSLAPNLSVLVPQLDAKLFVETQEVEKDTSDLISGWNMTELSLILSQQCEHRLVPDIPGLNLSAVKHCEFAVHKLGQKLLVFNTLALASLVSDPENLLKLHYTVYNCIIKGVMNGLSDISYFDKLEGWGKTLMQSWKITWREYKSLQKLLDHSGLDLELYRIAAFKVACIREWEKVVIKENVNINNELDIRKKELMDELEQILSVAKKFRVLDIIGGVEQELESLRMSQVVDLQGTRANIKKFQLALQHKASFIEAQQLKYSNVLTTQTITLPPICSFPPITRGGVYLDPPVKCEKQLKILTDSDVICDCLRYSIETMSLLCSVEKEEVLYALLCKLCQSNVKSCELGLTQFRAQVFQRNKCVSTSFKDIQQFMNELHGEQPVWLICTLLPQITSLKREIAECLEDFKTEIGTTPFLVSPLIFLMSDLFWVSGSPDLACKMLKEEKIILRSCKRNEQLTCHVRSKLNIPSSAPLLHQAIAMHLTYFVELLNTQGKNKEFIHLDPFFRLFLILSLVVAGYCRLMELTEFGQAYPNELREKFSTILSTIQTILSLSEEEKDPHYHFKHIQILLRNNLLLDTTLLNRMTLSLKDVASFLSQHLIDFQTEVETVLHVLCNSGEALAGASEDWNESKRHIAVQLDPQLVEALKLAKAITEQGNDGEITFPNKVNLLPQIERLKKQRAVLLPTGARLYNTCLQIILETIITTVKTLLDLRYDEEVSSLLEDITIDFPVVDFQILLYSLNTLLILVQMPIQQYFTDLSAFSLDMALSKWESLLTRRSNQILKISVVFNCQIQLFNWLVDVTQSEPTSLECGALEKAFQSSAPFKSVSSPFEIERIQLGEIQPCFTLIQSIDNVGRILKETRPLLESRHSVSSVMHAIASNGLLGLWELTILGYTHMLRNIPSKWERIMLKDNGPDWTQLSVAGFSNRAYALSMLSQIPQSEVTTRSYKNQVDKGHVLAHLCLCASEISANAARAGLQGTISDSKIILETFIASHSVIQCILSNPYDSAAFTQVANTLCLETQYLTQYRCTSKAQVIKCNQVIEEGLCSILNMTPKLCSLATNFSSITEDCISKCRQLWITAFQEEQLQYKKRVQDLETVWHYTLVHFAHKEVDPYNLTRVETLQKAIHACDIHICDIHNAFWYEPRLELQSTCTNKEKVNVRAEWKQVKFQTSYNNEFQVALHVNDQFICRRQCQSFRGCWTDIKYEKQTGEFLIAQFSSAHQLILGLKRSDGTQIQDLKGTVYYSWGHRRYTSGEPMVFQGKNEISFSITLENGTETATSQLALEQCIEIPIKEVFNLTIWYQVRYTFTGDSSYARESLHFSDFWDVTKALTASVESVKKGTLLKQNPESRVSLLVERFNKCPTKQMLTKICQWMENLQTTVKTNDKKKIVEVLSALKDLPHELHLETHDICAETLQQEANAFKTFRTKLSKNVKKLLWWISVRQHWVKIEVWINQLLEEHVAPSALLKKRVQWKASTSIIQEQYEEALKTMDILCKYADKQHLVQQQVAAIHGLDLVNEQRVTYGDILSLKMVLVSNFLITGKGSSLQCTSDDVDFGVIYVGTPQQQVLRIFNDTSLSISLGILQPSNNCFRVRCRSNFSLDAHETVDVTIEVFSPTEGDVMSTFTVVHNNEAKLVSLKAQSRILSCILSSNSVNIPVYSSSALLCIATECLTPMILKLESGDESYNVTCHNGDSKEEINALHSALFSVHTTKAITSKESLISIHSDCGYKATLKVLHKTCENLEIRDTRGGHIRDFSKWIPITAVRTKHHKFEINKQLALFNGSTEYLTVRLNHDSDTIKVEPAIMFLPPQTKMFVQVTGITANSPLSLTPNFIPKIDGVTTVLQINADTPPLRLVAKNQYQVPYKYKNQCKENCVHFLLQNNDLFPYADVVCESLSHTNGPSKLSVSTPFQFKYTGTTEFPIPESTRNYLITIQFTFGAPMCGVFQLSIHHNNRTYIQNVPYVVCPTVPCLEVLDIPACGIMNFGYVDFKFRCMFSVSNLKSNSKLEVLLVSSYLFQGSRQMKDTEKKRYPCLAGENFFQRLINIFTEEKVSLCFEQVGSSIPPMSFFSVPVFVIPTNACHQKVQFLIHGMMGSGPSSSNCDVYEEFIPDFSFPSKITTPREFCDYLRVEDKLTNDSEAEILRICKKSNSRVKCFTIQTLLLFLKKTIGVQDVIRLSVASDAITLSNVLGLALFTEEPPTLQRVSTTLISLFKNDSYASRIFSFIAEANPIEKIWKYFAEMEFLGSDRKHLLSTVNELSPLNLFLILVPPVLSSSFLRLWNWDDTLSATLDHLLGYLILANNSELLEWTRIIQSNVTPSCDPTQRSKNLVSQICKDLPYFTDLFKYSFMRAPAKDLFLKLLPDSTVFSNTSLVACAQALKTTLVTNHFQSLMDKCILIDRLKEIFEYGFHPDFFIVVLQLLALEKKQQKFQVLSMTLHQILEGSTTKALFFQLMKRLTHAFGVQDEVQFPPKDSPLSAIKEYFQRSLPAQFLCQLDEDISTVLSVTTLPEKLKKLLETSTLKQTMSPALHNILKLYLTIPPINAPQDLLPHIDLIIDATGLFEKNTGLLVKNVVEWGCKCQPNMDINFSSLCAFMNYISAGLALSNVVLQEHKWLPNCIKPAMPSVVISQSISELENTSLLHTLVTASMKNEVEIHKLLEQLLQQKPTRDNC
ncbi:Dynein heavy chain, cytoplasmic [Pelomyxa schiedti]|nr:Dynein heavy chain, cytoplasmic [Pelomyxa schiedti]